MDPAEPLLTDCEREQQERQQAEQRRDARTNANNDAPTNRQMAQRRRQALARGEPDPYPDYQRGPRVRRGGVDDARAAGQRRRREREREQGVSGNDNANDPNRPRQQNAQPDPGPARDGAREEEDDEAEAVEAQVQRLVEFNTSAEPHWLGEMNYMCTYCHALHFSEERLANTRDRPTAEFSRCCGRGKVVIPAISGSFSELERWLTEDTAQAKAFRKNIRRYNNAFAFTSIGMRMDYRTWGPRGLYALRISGRISHSLGALQPNPGASHKFCQIYMLDDADAVEQRAQHHTMITRRDIADGLDREILHVLKAFIRGHNEIAMMFVGAGQRFRDSPNSNAINIMQIEGGPDPRRYNMPTDRHTIAAVFLEEDAVPDGRDFWVHRLGSDMPEQVSELDEKFLAM